MQLKSSFVHSDIIDEVLYARIQEQDVFYHQDGLNSVKALTDVSGNAVASYDYDAWGNIIGSLPAIANPFAYTGREYDKETGLYYYRARYYSPQIGRFITQDPIGLLGGINLYSYVGNNPVNKIDPMGLKECCKQSWAECYTKCINTLAPGFGTFFIGTNIIGNAAFSAGDIVLLTIGDAQLPPPTNIKYLISSPAQRAVFTRGALLVGRAAFTAQAIYTAWTAGVSYGCMISCAMDSCNY